MKKTETSGVVEMQLLFSSLMPLLLEVPLRVHSTNQITLSKFLDEMTSVTEDLSINLQDCKTSTANRIDEIKHLILENATENEITQHNNNLGEIQIHA